MKKIIPLLLVLAFATEPLSAKENDKKEYNQLILQCRNIRTRILQENNFEIIKQNTLQSYQTTIANIAHRFTAGTNAALSSPSFASQLDNTQQLENSLAVLEAEHNLRTNSLIIQTIAAFLIETNSKTANKLLSELIANGFTF